MNLNVFHLLIGFLEKSPRMKLAVHARF